ncbi:MAG TPA: nuclear transport factor 2 family protein [Waddliaceae bacterium]|jgi:ketosteroid isomerase-like protein
MTTETAIPIKTENKNPSLESFALKFRKVLFGDDLDGFMQLFNNDAVWTFMATGEKFTGIEEIRKGGAKAMTGRVHTKDFHMEGKNLFWSDEWVCIEYLHHCLAPEHAIISGSPKAGTEIALPICITMHIKNGKIDTFNEYLNLATITGKKETLFS